MKISKTLARRIALNTQLLDNKTRLPRGKEGVARLIEKLGYIQIDTIAVVERAHNHTIWTRCPDYHPDMLHELQTNDRRIFEYWGHEASYLPMADYRYYLEKMRYFRNPTSEYLEKRLKKSRLLMKSVLERIRAEGPLGSRDFKDNSGKKRGTWWNWAPAKYALEFLFWTGELMVTKRRNFSRVYDLTERVLPDNLDLRHPDRDELGRFLVRRALNSYGLAGKNEIQQHIRTTDQTLIEDAIKELLDANEIISIQIDGRVNRVYFALADQIEKLARLRKSRSYVHILSPFDNHLIQRDRIKNLFDFDYSLECYLPAAKRKYGYFVLPVMFGEEFAARFDCKADRKNKSLIVKNLVMENGIDKYEQFLPEFSEKLREFAAFNGCRKIHIQKTKPASVKKILSDYLNRN